MMNMQLIFNTTRVSPIYEKMRNSTSVGDIVLTMNDGHRIFKNEIKLIKYFVYIASGRFNADCKETSPKNIEWVMDGITFSINGDQWFSDFCNGGKGMRPVKFHEILDIFDGMLHFIYAKKLDKDNKFEVYHSLNADYLMLLISIGLNPDDVDVLGVCFANYPTDDSTDDSTDDICDLNLDEF